MLFYIFSCLIFQALLIISLIYAHLAQIKIKIPEGEARTREGD